MKHRSKLLMLIVAGCVGLGGWHIGWQAPAIAGELGATAVQLTTSDVGLARMDETVCTSCHNDKGPTYDSSTPFNFYEMKKKDAHEHKELELREE